MRNEYSTFDVMKALEIDRERLRVWMVKGYVAPTIEADGAGTRAVFNRVDVYLVEFFKNLLEGGLSRSAAAIFIKHVRKNKKFMDRLANIDYIVLKKRGSNTWEAMTYKGEIENALFKSDPKESFMWEQINIYNFAIIRQKVDSKLKKV